MNNFPAVTMISWETRNWRHHKKALIWCKDYSLKSVARTLYVGKLYPKERKILADRFRGTFDKKTERFALFTLCQSCFEVASLSDTIKANVAQISHFELVQISDKTQ